ncbi:MAG: hypothetical protein KGI23_03845, partial [Patescibacteria group bacterium]|nr:hypothetical protein [Patescibacteria group bacterium]
DLPLNLDLQQRPDTFVARYGTSPVCDSGRGGVQFPTQGQCLKKWGKYTHLIYGFFGLITATVRLMVIM